MATKVEVAVVWSRPFQVKPTIYPLKSVAAPTTAAAIAAAIVARVAAKFWFLADVAAAPRVLLALITCIASTAT